jgi:hypothetical protein
MQYPAPSALALAMLFSVGSASACAFHPMSMASPQPAQPVASATLKQMVLTYRTELADDHRIA